MKSRPGSFLSRNQWHDVRFHPTPEDKILTSMMPLSFFCPQVTVPELAPAGSSVLTLSATDIESSEDISYRILSSSEGFAVDPRNGELPTVTLGHHQ